jgi:hypothetical protein
VRKDCVERVEGKGREGKGREGKGKEGKGKGRGRGRGHAYTWYPDINGPLPHHRTTTAQKYHTCALALSNVTAILLTKNQ